MDTLQSPSLHPAHRSVVAVLQAAWQLVRWPLLTFLVLLEPIVTFVFMGLALLGVMMSLFYRYVVALPGFPFGLMMGLSLGMAMLLIPYYGLMRMLAR